MRPQLANEDPAALSLLGMLRRRTAVAAARRHDRAATVDLIGRAQRAADLRGRDANYWQTGFGPTNVELHRISTYLDLGDVDYVVPGPAVTPAGLPAERRVSHMIGVARALSLAAHDEDATRLLLEAAELAGAQSISPAMRMPIQRSRRPSRSTARCVSTATPRP